MRRLPPPLMLALTISATTVAAHAADGAKIFLLQCKTCHQAASSAGGPSLVGVAGRRVASLGDYAYSSGLKAKDGVWNDASLDAYLTSPAKFAPGTRMPAALAAATDRAAVIAFLKTLK